MATQNFETQIKRAIESFVEELSELVRAAAVQSVTEAFGGGAGPARALAGGRALRPTRTRGKGEKRRPEDLAALAGQLLSAVKATPGQRMEQIAKALKTTTQELALPAKKLIADKKIKTKGERRATKYFPA